MSFQWWVSPSSPTAYAHHNIKLDFYRRRANHTIKAWSEPIAWHNLIIPFIWREGPMMWLGIYKIIIHLLNTLFNWVGSRLMWIVDLLCSNVKNATTVCDPLLSNINILLSHIFSFSIALHWPVHGPSEQIHIPSPPPNLLFFNSSCFPHPHSKM